MNKSDLKTMTDADLFSLQTVLAAKYEANETLDIKLLRKVDAELNARFN